MDKNSWAGTESPLSLFVANESAKAFSSYEARPDLVREHSNIEAAISQGGYGHRQLNELIQNAADAITTAGENSGKIHVVLTKDSLYCANEGSPLSESGYRTLMLSHSSEKRENQIGRFGLGFKSVIQITSSPEIYSRTGSVVWNHASNRERLTPLIAGLDKYPILRIATPVDPYFAAEKDQILAQMMTWATTIVKLPLQGETDWISDEIRNFPHEFLLFSDKVESLELDDFTTKSSTVWRSTHNGNKVSLWKDSDIEDWIVFKSEHQVSSKAAAEAGSIVARPSIDVTWAVPISAPQANKLGRFWNYFPTQHKTSLRGLVNAAFKMNEDRHGMLETAYNEEILTKTVPKMIAGALVELSTLDDPGMFLDLLPSRAKEYESWPDKIINRPTFTAVTMVPCLPDGAGQLRMIHDIKVQPELREATRLESLWESWTSVDSPWLHRLALTPKRAPQIDRMLKDSSLSRASIEDWLEEVVTGGRLQDYENALQLAAMIDKSYPEYREPMRRSRIVLMGNGSVQAPIVSRVFLPMDASEKSSSVVSYELLSHGNANSYLRALDLQSQDGSGRVIRAASEVAKDYKSKDESEALWEITRALKVPEATSILNERLEPERIMVRCRDEHWRPLGETWLPGALIPVASIGNDSILIDDYYHRHDLALVRALGARSDISDPTMVISGPTYENWKSEVQKTVSAAARGIDINLTAAGVKVPRALVTAGLELLTEASISVRAKATEKILTQTQYPVKIDSTNTHFSSQIIDGPDLWWIKNHGAFKTILGFVNTNEIAPKTEGVSDGFLPIIDEKYDEILSATSDLKTVAWPRVLSVAERALSIADLHVLYGQLAFIGVKSPKELLATTKAGGTGRFITSDLPVSRDEATRQHLLSMYNISSIYSGDELHDSALENNWGLKSKQINFTTSLQTIPSDSTETASIKELFPKIKRIVSSVLIQTNCIPCSSIELLQTNDYDDYTESEAATWYLEPGTLYYRSPISSKGLLTTILAAFSSTKTTADVLNGMKVIEQNEAADRKRKAAQGLETDAEKVAALVGQNTLLALIPDSVIELLDAREIDLTDQRLFDIVTTLHGTSLLKVLKDALEDAGIETPGQFGGSQAAKDFVADMGFSPEMAGEKSKRKPKREEVLGPVRLNPLHDYQESTSRKIEELLSHKSGTARGLVQLPTGAGKTRVAVESVIRHASGLEGKQIIVWIAQSDELCEQAIDTWMYVWQAAGPSGERMAVSRLWDGNNVTPEETKLHLVVATIQTLSSIVDTKKQVYDWMSKPDLVIIDEAHGATAPSYTKVLSWFGRSFSEKSRSLLGLSATPYRGSSEAETKRLVARFGGNLIEPEEFTADNAHDYLQKKGVLAAVRHEELQGIDLRLKDIRSVTDDGTMSPMLEARLDLQHVADSVQRNDAILNHIKTNKNIGPTLVFAASVEHAEALAAVLTLEGIPAAAIAGKTDMGYRRKIIEDFRNGKIRVLTNFDVLTQGFDAPKVDSVYVCRPTFSPNKYIQMIGRGLRGPP